ncbi:unnamed protein product [Amoebophrya sp. A25]|nr:unnamed protein product [Amoebophrya sp. A25]|eukprot:GSA25T00021529001.1
MSSGASPLITPSPKHSDNFPSSSRRNSQSCRRSGHAQHDPNDPTCSWHQSPVTTWTVRSRFLLKVQNAFYCAFCLYIVVVVLIGAVLLYVSENDFFDEKSNSSSPPTTHKHNNGQGRGPLALPANTKSTSGIHWLLAEDAHQNFPTHFHLNTTALQQQQQRGDIRNAGERESADRKADYEEQATDYEEELSDGANLVPSSVQMHTTLRTRRGRSSEASSVANKLGTRRSATNFQKASLSFSNLAAEPPMTSSTRFPDIPSAPASTTPIITQTRELRLTMVDAFFYSMSCVTQAGLSVTDWPKSRWTTHVISLCLMLLGCAPLLALGPPLLRRYNFEKQHRTLRKMQRLRDLQAQNAATLQEPRAGPSLGTDAVEPGRASSASQPPNLPSAAGQGDALRGNSSTSTRATHDSHVLESEVEEMVSTPPPAYPLEYFALGVIIRVTILYCVVFMLGGFALLYVSYHHLAPDTHNGHDLPPRDGTWRTIFYAAVSAFCNNGLTLSENSMLGYPRAFLLTAGGLILAGNTMFPVLLRWYLLVLHWYLDARTAQGGTVPSSSAANANLTNQLRPPPSTSSSDSVVAPLESSTRTEKRAVAFLLKHPRRVFTHLFPQVHTVWLFLTVLALNTTCTVSILIFEAGDYDMWTCLFQAFATRTAGFSALPLRDLCLANNLLLCIWMYIAASPTTVVMRRTRVRESDRIKRSAFSSGRRYRARGARARCNEAREAFLQQQQQVLLDSVPMPGNAFSMVNEYTSPGEQKALTKSGGQKLAELKAVQIQPRTGNGWHDDQWQLSPTATTMTGDLGSSRSDTFSLSGAVWSPIESSSSITTDIVARTADSAVCQSDELVSGPTTNSTTSSQTERQNHNHADRYLLLQSSASVSSSVVSTPMTLVSYEAGDEFPRTGGLNTIYLPDPTISSFNRTTREEDHNSTFVSTATASSSCSSVASSSTSGSCSEIDITGKAEGVEDDTVEPNSIRAQAWHYLGQDVSALLLLTFSICLAERHRFRQASDAGDADSYRYNVFFKFLYEIVSAYGTVGLSLGGGSAVNLARECSFSGSWTPTAKLLLCLVMLLGKLRGLPDSIDPSVKIHANTTSYSTKDEHRNPSQVINTNILVENTSTPPGERLLGEGAAPVLNPLASDVDPSSRTPPAPSPDVNAYAHAARESVNSTAASDP